MNYADDERLVGLLSRVLRDCRKLYQRSATWMIRRYPQMIEGNSSQFAEMMDDLHRGLAIKVYVTIVRADDRWTTEEKKVAAAMIEHLWGEKLRGSKLREAATGLFQQVDMLTWESLVAPFVRYHPLAESKTQVETIVMRLANLVAKCDGQTMPEEAVALHTLQRDIDMALNPAEPDKMLAPLTPVASSPSAQQKKYEGNFQASEDATPHQELSPQERSQRLKAAMEELDQLIGLQVVKDRVRSYANFLRLQQQRKISGLATMPITLHMVFSGNPGTGKTTVARIVGQILGAMGTLPSGHVVETDRSGLVAQFAGQTGPKTNQLCDSAIGGVLFIDEAYSLIDESGDDAYGREAVQTLLKRMEDDRDRMAVILAGYSNEMNHMIRSNPGLSSRINTRIDFEDYQPLDLGKIFEVMCEQNQYKLPSEARHRLLVGFHHLYEQRDQHFGNGRLVRNTFEDTVRRLADRVAEISVLTEDVLTSLTEGDIAIPAVSNDQLDKLVANPHQLKIVCEGCQRKVVIRPSSLGMHVKCTKCNKVQPAPWANVSSAD